MTTHIGNTDRRAARRAAWVLGVTVLCIYLGYIAWNFWRAGLA